MWRPQVPRKHVTHKWHLDLFIGARKNLNIGRKAHKSETKKTIIAHAAVWALWQKMKNMNYLGDHHPFLRLEGFSTTNLIPQRSSLNRALPGSMAEWTQEILQWARAKTTISRCLTVSSLWQTLMWCILPSRWLLTWLHEGEVEHDMITCWKLKKLHVPCTSSTDENRPSTTKPLENVAGRGFACKPRRVSVYFHVFSFPFILINLQVRSGHGHSCNKLPKHLQSLIYLALARVPSLTSPFNFHKWIYDIHGSNIGLQVRLQLLLFKVHDGYQFWTIQ